MSLRTRLNCLDVNNYTDREPQKLPEKKGRNKKHESSGGKKKLKHINLTGGCALCPSSCLQSQERPFSSQKKGPGTELLRTRRLRTRKGHGVRIRRDIGMRSHELEVEDGGAILGSMLWVNRSTQNGSLVNFETTTETCGPIPGGLILTHTHVDQGLAQTLNSRAELCHLDQPEKCQTGDKRLSG